MKNIHLIQTDKPTGLFESQSGVLHYSIMNKVRTGLLKGYHIYITSDEKTLSNNGDYYLSHPNYNTIHKWYMVGMHKNKQVWINKIILTTDPDLIVDGVQAIDGEFSEWFVKNPSCEEVKTRKIGEEWIYNADVPQEEPKHISAKPFLDNADEVIVIHRPKQETLEEAAERYATKQVDISMREDTLEFSKSGEELYQESKIDFIEGGKWQEEQDKNKYNEEDMLEFAEYCLNNVDAFVTPEHLIEQFKKK